jgi:hypothetical protein
LGVSSKFAAAVLAVTNALQSTYFHCVAVFCRVEVLSFETLDTHTAAANFSHHKEFHTATEVLLIRLAPLPLC